MSKNAGLGFLCAAISILGFGSNFVPVKKYDMGNGMFFQLQQALGIFTVGVVVQIFRGYQSIFRPYAMLGGFLWCTGNCMCTMIIKFVGLSLGVLIWGASNMITGWCMGEWGLFGTRRDDAPYYPGLNVAGVITALVGTSLLFFVKPIDDIDSREERKKAIEQWAIPDEEDETGVMKNSKKEALLKYPSSEDDNISKDELFTKTSWVDNLTTEQKRVAGITMSMIAGILFGVNFAPPIHLSVDQTTVDPNGLHYSTHGLDYVFSHFTGVLFTSLMWFLIYCVMEKNKPWVNGNVILPGWLSGVMWGIAQTAWFVANENLGIVIAYPIITTGPGIIASLWGVCVFGEIKGKYNLYMLLLAFAISFIAILLISLSKDEGLLKN